MDLKGSNKNQARQSQDDIEYVEFDDFSYPDLLNKSQGRERKYSTNEDDYQFITRDEKAIIEFHQNHNIQLQQSLKQLFSNSLTNIGFKIFKNGTLIAPFPEYNKTIQIFNQKFETYEDFFKFFQSIIWLTYKRNFKPLLIERPDVKHLTSDGNWGCTIRCGQMLIANALKFKTDESILSILNLFDDDMRQKKESAFSIQNIVLEGLNFGKFPGDWYGINSVFNILAKLNDKYQPVKRLKICVFQDGSFIQDEIEQAAQESLSSSIDEKVNEYEVVEEQQDELVMSLDWTLNRQDQNQVQVLDQFWKNNLLLIVNLRLGLDRIPENYFKVIQKYMKMPEFVGLIGGKPNLAFYFVGQMENDNLVFLDPHIIQKKVENIQENYEENKYCFHQQEGRYIHMSKLDPCISFGFMLKSLKQYQDFIARIQKGIDVDGDDAIFSVFVTQNELEEQMRAVTFRSSFLNHSSLSFNS